MDAFPLGCAGDCVPTCLPSCSKDSLEYSMFTVIHASCTYVSLHSPLSFHAFCSFRAGIRVHCDPHQVHPDETHVEDLDDGFFTQCLGHPVWLHLVAPVVVARFWWNKSILLEVGFPKGWIQDGSFLAASHGIGGLGSLTTSLTGCAAWNSLTSRYFK